MTLIYRPPSTVSAPSSGWVRPSEWLRLPIVVAGEQRIVGLHAITNTNSNFVALSCAGAYSVDWGDGSPPINYAANAVASNNLIWTNYSSSPLTSEGFRQAIITVTPQAGQTLTTVNFNATHPQSGLFSDFTRGWLDIAMAGASISSLTINNQRLLRQFRFIGSNNITNFTNFLSNCNSVVSVPLFDTAAGVIFTSFLFACSSLVSVPLFNTSSGTVFNNFMQLCAAVSFVPLFNVASGTNFGNFMQSCGSLTVVPAFNFSSGTNFTGTLSGARLVSCNATGARFSISFANMVLGRAELVNIFNNLGTASSPQTITITGNYGASLLTAAERAIATNKGWTIAG